jgi:hypothetical protein
MKAKCEFVLIIKGKKFVNLLIGKLAENILKDFLDLQIFLFGSKNDV